MRAREPRELQTHASCRRRVVALLVLAIPVALTPQRARGATPQATRPLDQQKADELLTRARHLIAKGACVQAVEVLRKALAVDPRNAACRRLLDEAQNAVLAPEGRNLIQPIKEQYARRAQSLIRQSAFSVHEAKAALERQDYEASEQHARRALAAIGYIGSAQGGLELRNQAQIILDNAVAARKRQRLLIQQRELEHARADAVAARKRRAAVESTRTKPLRLQAARLFADGEYEDAIEAADKVLRVSPDDPEASLIREEASRGSIGPGSLRGRSPLRRKRADRFLAQVEKELAVHPRAQVVLPAKEKRSRAGLGIRSEPMEDWERELRARLCERVAIEFKQTPLQDCVRQLAALGKINIILDPAAAKDTDISLRTSGCAMPLDSCLKWVSRFAGLHYTLRDGAVYLTTRRGMLDEPVQRSYIVSSLVIPDEDAVPTAVIDARNLGMPGPVEPNQRRTPVVPTKPDPEVVGEGWAGFLKNTIAPGTWEVTLQEEGPRYTIQYRNGRIVVVHTPDVHKQIEGLLNNFRRARNLQVHIVGRFLEISQTYLESLVLQSVAWQGPGVNGPGRDAEGGGKRYAFTPVTISNMTDIIKEVSDPLDPEADPVLLPLARFPSLTPSGGMALNWNYIGVWGHQAQAVLNAIVKRQNVTLLSAPRITCFNTQRANLQVLVNRNYVRRISSDDEPEIGNIPEGMIFDVQPFVSADRRYITIVLQPQQRTLVGTPTVFGYSTGLEENLPDDWVGPIPTVGRSIQVPTTRLRSIGTTVTVPNGGTLIAGGFTEVEERVGKTGVPIVSSIPLLRNVFQGWDSAEGRRSLILLISAETVRDIFTEED